MDLVSLKEIGLTDGEVKVYLALLGLGSTKTGPLATKARVSSSKVYKILARLENKGLVTHVVKGKITFFRALEPKRILDYVDEEREKLEEKRKSVEELIPSLQKQMHSLAGPQATIFTGFKSVSNFFRNILDELKSGEEYFVIGARYVEDLPEQMRFFYKYHQLRALKKIKVNMLMNNDMRKMIVPATRSCSELRFLPNYLISNLQITFYKHKVMLIVWTNEPIGFLIESEEVAKSFKKYFDAFWKVAEK